MDIIFKCTSCDQELAVDSTGAGSEITCPTCNTKLLIPEASAQNAAPAVPPGGTSTAHKVEKHFSVPQRVAPEGLIKKPNPTLDVAVKDVDKKVRVKTIRHGDHIEVGKDKFDEHVAEFLQKVGQENVVSITPINYSHLDPAGRNLVEDFGILIIYKG